MTEQYSSNDLIWEQKRVFKNTKRLAGFTNKCIDMVCIDKPGVNKYT